MKHVVYRETTGQREYLADLVPGIATEHRAITTTEADRALKLSMEVAIIIANDLNNKFRPTWKVKATTCPAT